MKKIILIVFTFLFLVSCSKDDPVLSTSNSPPPNGPNGYGITLQPTTHEFKTPAELSTISSASANSISFSSDPGLKTGDVIICGISSSTPDGLIKKITGSLSKITGGTTYSTTDASLSDAVKSGRFEFNKSLFNFNQNFSNQIYSGVTFTGAFSESANLFGFLDFNNLPTISGKLGFTFNGSVDLNLSAELNKTFDETKTIYSQSLAPIVVFPDPPIVITPKVSLYVKLQGKINGKISSGVTDNLSITASLSYDKIWTFEKSGTNTFQFKPVVINFSTDLKAIVGGSVEFLVYGTLGPSVSVEPYSRVHANLQETPIWALYAGVDINAGISTGWLSPLISGRTFGPFNLYEVQLASGGSGVNRPPSEPNTPSPRDGDDKVISPVTLSWNPCTDPDGDPVSYDLLVGKNLENPVTISNLTSPSYYMGNLAAGTNVFWKVTSKDNHGNSTVGKLWYFRTSSTGINKTLTLQPGPSDGNDTFVKFIHYPDGSEYYFGFPDSSKLEISNDLSGQSESLIKFDLSKISSGSKIVSATLKLYGYGTVNYTNQIPTISLIKLINQWDERFVKWNNKPSSYWILDKQLINQGILSWYEIDVTATVQEWINGTPNYGFGLMTNQSSYHGNFYSSDNSDATHRPILEIIYQ